MKIGHERRRAWIGAVVMTTAVGCASTVTPAAPALRRELVLSHDDARSTGTMAFPDMTYETVVRFELPAGEHQPLRLRFQAEASGQVEINIYDSTIVETPGERIKTIMLTLERDDLSDGRDGRWVVADLGDMRPLTGVVWVGVHKLGGAPTIWASSVVSGQAFVRNNDPHNLMGLLPTKRTPLLRLEVAP